jgi:hypothetical protein
VKAEDAGDQRIGADDFEPSKTEKRTRRPGGLSNKTGMARDNIASPEADRVPLAVFSGRTLRYTVLSTYVHRITPIFVKIAFWGSTPFVPDYSQNGS